MVLNAEEAFRHCLALVQLHNERGSSITRKGVLIQSSSGAGKTWLLKTLGRSLKPNEVTYLDCSTIVGVFVGDIERYLISTFRDAAMDGKLLLLDDVDCLFSQHTTDSGGSRAIPSLTSSAFLSALDDLAFGGGFLVATCTRPTSLPHGLTLTRRLGDPIILSFPTAHVRKDVFMGLLSDPRLKIVPDSSDLEELCTELSLRTQGCSVGDVLKLVQNCMHSSLLQTCQQQFTESEGHVIVSCQDLLNEAYNIKPSSASDKLSNLLNQTLPVSEILVGLEEQQLQLKRAILGSFNEKRQRACRGVIIHGPSGTGKTSLAAWIAFVSKSRFRLLVVPCADLVHKVVGESEKRITDCFEAARSMAPCLLLLDNLEIILGGTGGDGGDDGFERGTFGRQNRTSHVALDRLLSSLLVEIDGLGDPKSVVGGGNNGSSARETTNPVIVIATTTNLACLDKALTRPGRLEEHIALNLPDHDKRFHLAMQLLLKFDMSRFQGPTSQEEISRIAHTVAERTSGLSFAQVVSLVQMAAQTALACYLKGEKEKCTLEDLFRTFFPQVK